MSTNTISTTTTTTTDAYVAAANKLDTTLELDYNNNSTAHSHLGHL